MKLLLIILLLLNIKSTYAIVSYNPKLLQPYLSHQETMETTSTLSQIDLGILYDCTSVTPMGVFEFPTLKNCKHDMRNMENDLQEMKTWNGKVKKYQPKTTKFDVYLCTMKYITKRCNEKFFEEIKEYTEEEVSMTGEQCIKMKRNLVAEYDGHTIQLHKVRESHWETKDGTGYSCTWLKDKTTSMYKASLTKYPAQIIGDSPTIEQHVFSTECSSHIPKGKNFTWCTTYTDSTKIIAWEDPKHNSAGDAVFNDLGTHEIKQIGDYILIESLLMGGAIQRELGETSARAIERERGEKYTVIQLDNGIVIEHLHAKINAYKQFKQTLKKYAKLVGSDVMAPILEGHLTSVIIEQKTAMIREWERTCFVQKELQKIQRWMINTFPTSSARWIHQQAGVVVHPAGDALHVSKCMQIENYKIHFDRKLNLTCYRDFPIDTSITNTTRFLRIVDRQIVSTSSKIDCTKRPQHTYLKATNGSYYLITSNGNITEAYVDRDTAKEPHDTNLKKLRGYNPDWIVKIPEHLEPYAMMEVIAYTQDAIREMADIQRDLGGGNLLVGIIKAFGTVLESAAGGGSEIIKSIGGGMKDVFEGFGDMDEKIINSLGTAGSKVIDSTGGAIKNTGTGIGNIFHGIFGGIGGTIKWAIILLLIIGFIYMNRESIKRTICKPKKPENKTHTTSNTRFGSEKTKKSGSTFNPEFLKTISPKEKPQPTNV